MSMVSIVRYGTRAGPDNQKILRITTNLIVMKNHGVTSVDLSGITNMENLQRLDIAGNRLEQIDLAPIAECEQLRYLDLSGNRLENIDLAPIEECRHLERLDLAYNKLKTIDITPLHNCSNLKNLYLHGNSIGRIDATVLLNCPNIEQITLGYGGKILVGHLVADEKGMKYFSDQLLQYALTQKKPSWLKHEKMGPLPATKNYSWLVKKFGWMQNKAWMTNIGKALGEDHGYPLQRILLESLGMPELACYDGEFLDIIQLLPDKGSYKKGVDILRIRMLEVLIKQLENNGSTLFFDIDALSIRDASVLIPLILKRRKKELERIRLFSVGKSVDLTPLWKTGYGFEILKAMNLRRSIAGKDFPKVKKAFAQVGVKLSLTQDPQKIEKNKVPLLSQTMEKFVIPSS
ncbi:MAG: leucine-rich repeat domain-containing protein [Candidatus Thorarchaeota archaeon]|nr:leucine-rich repeat domain-containing protein [Candidatus Thorarchaeota archaeon]